MSIDEPGGWAWAPGGLLHPSTCIFAAPPLIRPVPLLTCGSDLSVLIGQSIQDLGRASRNKELLVWLHASYPGPESQVCTVHRVLTGATLIKKHLLIRARSTVTLQLLAATHNPVSYHHHHEPSINVPPIHEFLLPFIMLPSAYMNG